MKWYVGTVHLIWLSRGLTVWYSNVSDGTVMYHRMYLLTEGFIGYGYSL